MNTWPFDDPQNVAVFTVRPIMEGSDWISYVSHDADDGSWQFHGSDDIADEKQAMIVALAEIVRIDATILDLADLPLGWYAWRETSGSPWQRSPKTD